MKLDKDWAPRKLRRTCVDGFSLWKAGKKKYILALCYLWYEGNPETIQTIVIFVW
jgi:hypothetical protein